MVAPGFDEKKLWKAIYEQEHIASQMAGFTAR